MFLRSANYAEKHTTGTDQQDTVLLITRHKKTFYTGNTLNETIELWPYKIIAVNYVVFTYVNNKITDK